MTGETRGLGEILRPRLGAVAGIVCGLIGTFASLQLPLGTSRLLGPGAVPLLLAGNDRPEPRAADQAGFRRDRS